MKVTVVTGLSGAGRSVAAGAFEDQGWFVIDNLPVTLVSKIAELASSANANYDRVALVMAGYDAEMAEQVDHLRSELDEVSVLFLEASTKVLIRRYESTKRRHPLSDGTSLTDAIEAERDRLMAARASADLVIDTSDLNPHQLRDRLAAQFDADSEADAMRITVSSFGFKHGIPLDVDLVLDCRFLPNPHWEDELRPLSGKDQPVQDYVLDRAVTERFLSHLDNMFTDLLPAYANEGKSYLTIAFGCTGGRHRSVAVAERVAETLKDGGWLPRVSHRDIERR